MTTPYTGGCACGAIRYAISAEPMMMNDCQCRQCQRASGTGHGSYLTFPRAAVTLEGEAAHWDAAGDDGTVKSSAFCPTCGSPVHMTFPAMPDLFVVRAGSLDDPSRYRPQLVLWGAAAQAWDRVDPSLPRFDAMSPT
ncbi:MAG TPA: GFA family protein [Rubellimicrobium sp.]|nr:GFA family protein [Rubellimicrobium sp.]